MFRIILSWDALLGPHLRDDQEGRKEGADPSHSQKWKTLEAGNMNLPGTAFALGLDLPSIFNNISNIKHVFMSFNFLGYCRYEKLWSWATRFPKMMQDSIQSRIKNYSFIKCLMPTCKSNENRLQPGECTRQPWKVTQKPGSDPKSQGVFHILYYSAFFTHLTWESHGVCRVLLEKEMQRKLWSQRGNDFSGLVLLYDSTMNCRCSSRWLSPLQRKSGSRISRN